MPAALTDDDGHFAFEIQRFRRLRPDDRGAVGHLRVGEAGEDHRLLRRLAPAFQDMRHVVQPDAEDLVRVGDRRQQRHVIKLVAGVAGGIVTQRMHGPERIAQGGSQAAQIDDAGFLQNAPAGGTVRTAEGDEFHGWFPRWIGSHRASGRKLGQAGQGGLARAVWSARRPRDKLPQRHKFAGQQGEPT